MPAARSEHPTWEEVLGELYTLLPSHFVEVRERRATEAKAAGDRQLAQHIHALRRPTVSAYTLNLLARAEPDHVRQLLTLGQELRQAQSTWSGPRLRELAGQRAHLVTKLSAHAVHLAEDTGQPVSGAARAEVLQSLRAVLADPEAAGRFAEGQLAAALDEPTGFESLGGTPPPPRTRERAPSPRQSGTAPKKDTQERDRREAQRQAKSVLREAQRDLQGAQRQRERAAAAAKRARHEDEQARARAEEARQALRTAQEQAESAGQELSAREAAQQEAEQQVAAAERAVQAAQRQVDDVTP